MSPENQELQARIAKLEEALKSRPRASLARTLGFSIGALALGVLFWPKPAASQNETCPVPNCFSAGEPAVAADVNENFAYLADLGRTSNATVLEAVGTDSFALTVDNVFHDMADLTLTFTVDRPTAIVASYNITGQPSAASHLVTQLHIDEEVVDTAITGNTAFWNNRGTYLGKVDAGAHTIKVSYRTPAAAATHNPATSWQERHLNVLVFGDTQ